MNNDELIANDISHEEDDLNNEKDRSAPPLDLTEWLRML